jgi:hypothetical protein
MNETNLNSTALTSAPIRANQTNTEDDRVGFSFDWVPSVENNRIVFQVRISRGDRQSAVDFEIDLNRLGKDELEELRNFLVVRHSGLDSSSEIVRGVTWLLDISLMQLEPLLNKIERDARVQELLLSRQPTAKATDSAK